MIVEKEETRYLLEKVCRQLQIPLEKVNQLKVMPGVREDMQKQQW
jgi:hypothetical protein